MKTKLDGVAHEAQRGMSSEGHCLCEENEDCRAMLLELLSVSDHLSAGGMPRAKDVCDTVTIGGGVSVTLFPTEGCLS